MQATDPHPEPTGKVSIPARLAPSQPVPVVQPLARCVLGVRVVDRTLYLITDPCLSDSPDTNLGWAFHAASRNRHPDLVVGVINAMAQPFAAHGLMFLRSDELPVSLRDLRLGESENIEVSTCRADSVEEGVSATPSETTEGEPNADAVLMMGNSDPHNVTLFPQGLRSHAIVADAEHNHVASRVPVNSVCHGRHGRCDKGRDRHCGDTDCWGSQCCDSCSHGADAKAGGDRNTIRTCTQYATPAGPAPGAPYPAPSPRADAGGRGIGQVR